MKTIYLIGFMGCGKSTIGEGIQQKYGKEFVDTDTLIVKTQKQEIKDIFRIEGEKAFREYETKALKEASSYAVVATGGGIIQKEENVRIMKENGVIIYLQTSFKEIVKRLENDELRPLWNKSKTEEMEKLFKEREFLYEDCADYTIITEEQTFEEILKRVRNIQS